MKKLAYRLSILVLTIWPLTAFSTVYPKRKANTDVIYLEDPAVDMALRAKLISQAKYSVDFVAFSQAADKVGLPILKALRDAQDRGVKIRGMYELIGAKLEGDTRDEALKLLVDKSKSCPAEMVCGRPLNKWKNGLSLDDWIHEKALIIDAGTPDEKVIIGGRSHGKFALEFGDSAFLIRPIEFLKPSGTTDIKDYFDKTFNMLATAFGKEESRKVPKRTLLKLEGATPESLLETPAQRERYREILRTLEIPLILGQDLPPYQFRPKSTQLVSNDLLERLLLKKPKDGFASRLADPNDITNTLSRLIGRASSAEITGYAIGMTEKLRKSFERLIDRGGDLRMITNGRNVFVRMSPYLLRGAPMDFTLRDLTPLLEKGEKAAGKVDAYLLDVDKAGAALDAGLESPRPYFYVHRKQMLLDDKAVVGTDNFTEASTAKSNEFIYVIRDPRLVEYLHSQNAREIDQFFERLTAEKARFQYTHRPFCSDLMLNLIRRMF